MPMVTRLFYNDKKDEMKTYIRPLTDVVILNIVTDLMIGGEPKGSVDVNPMTPTEPEIIGGDEEGANTINVSLWDEE